MIDKQTERRVWQRIYPQSNVQPPKWQRERLTQCLRREEANFSYYDQLRMDPVYGPAFARLADEALEHSKMLRRILGG